MKYVLGIDVGGTKIAAGLVDKNHGIRRVYELSTSQSDLLKQIVKLIESYKDFHAIGLGIPGHVEANGWIARLPNVKNFKPINLKKYLENEFKVKVSVINDAEAFALAEATTGGGQKFNKVLGVILGTGIGGGLVIKGKHKNVDRILHSKLPGLEKQMQRTRTFKNDQQAGDIVRQIFSIIIPAAHPDIIVFGGGRTHYRGINQIIKQSLYLAYPKDNKTVVRVSKLKHAGIIGAALPLLKS